MACADSCLPGSRWNPPRGGRSPQSAGLGSETPRAQFLALQPSLAFLQKPYTPHTLARRVWEVLDVPPPAVS